MDEPMIIKINDTEYENLKLYVSKYKTDTIELRLISDNDELQEICEITKESPDINKNEMIINTSIYPFLKELIEAYELGYPTNKTINENPVYEINTKNINKHKCDCEKTI